MTKEKISVTFASISVSIIKRGEKMKEKNNIERLKDFKKSSGWSYHKLSIHIGVHNQTIYGWLFGRRSPSPLALEKLQKFLKSVERSGIMESPKR